MSNDYDVIIVGGGMGGLNLGALLSEAGKRVLILEKSGRAGLGGRAASGRIGNAAVDNGIKGLIMAGTEDEVYHRIGKTLPKNVCEWSNPGQLHIDGEWHEINALIMDAVEDFVKVYMDPVQDLSFEEIEGLNDVSVEEFMQARTDDQGIINFFRYLGWLFGGTLPIPHDYSVGSAFYSVKKQLDANGRMPTVGYWVEGGSGAIAGPLVESMESNGGEIRAGTAVSRIVVEDGRARGVEVSTGTRRVPTELLEVELIEADVVVSAVAIWDIFSILSEDDLSPWYAERLRYLHRKTLNLATLTYSTSDASVWDQSGPRWVQQGSVSGRPWCASSLNYSETEGEYEVSFWMQLGWWEKPNVHNMREASHKAALQQLFDDWEADIAELFPDLVQAADWKMKSFGPATIIETPGMVGSNLIDITAEGIDGLYLIGERTKEAKVMGVYGSAQVALTACDLILERG